MTRYSEWRLNDHFCILRISWNFICKGYDLTTWNKNKTTISHSQELLLDCPIPAKHLAWWALRSRSQRFVSWLKYFGAMPPMSTLKTKRNASAKDLTADFGYEHFSAVFPTRIRCLHTHMASEHTAKGPTLEKKVELKFSHNCFEI